jgi:hypothetical protein
MAASLADILGALQNGVAAVGHLRRTVAGIFPQSTPVTSSAPGVGEIVFNSSQATGFLAVTTSSGFTGWIAVYPSS